KVDAKTITLIASSITDLADDSGWAFLGEVGNLILKKKPDFDARNYGFERLVPLIKSIDQFEIDKRETEKKNGKLIFVRVKTTS
ncbi:MAG: Maebl, partial [Azospira oryzae]